MQAEIQGQYEAEFAAFEAGEYLERPQEWLATSWQGDALQARNLKALLYYACEKACVMAYHPVKPGRC